MKQKVTISENLQAFVDNIVIRNIFRKFIIITFSFEAHCKCKIEGQGEAKNCANETTGWPLHATSLQQTRGHVLTHLKALKYTSPSFGRKVVVVTVSKQGNGASELILG